MVRMFKVLGVLVLGCSRVTLSGLRCLRVRAFKGLGILGIGCFMVSVFNG